MSEVQWLKAPLFAKWYVTSRCNLRCRHCYLDDYSQKLPLHRMLHVADQLGDIGVRNVALLGGEPLIRDDLERIVQRLVTHGIVTRIATNGIFATPTRVKRLLQSGALRFQVSLEGHTAEQCDNVRGHGSFDKVAAGIRSLMEGGAIVTLAYTLTSHNHSDLARMVSLASSLGVHEVKFAAFVPAGSGADIGRDLCLNADMCREISTALWAAISAHPELKIDGGPFVKRLSSTSLARKPSSTFGCGAGTTTIVVNSDLSVSACDMQTQTDRTDQTLGQETALADIWSHDPLFARWRGQSLDETFLRVHQHGCHLAYRKYGRDLFVDENIADGR
ncbi:radical SAM protein [Pandoraea communis]|uniref:Coenzyme PQQ synthesis protein E n=1 Tax=Pandoraea communis TaxID=2508297 RepID=A0A5E4TIA8_9BURK|nr:radical SAM protein [Pandoraea communis]MDM8354846.1 radical SAM protein [Pandoraea communis]VVD86264.1 coenzyme PQQ synthesis protein E [Pandoraea communis]